MDNFRAKFLEEAVKNLKSLQNNSVKDFYENNRREAFRIVHSVKGSAQTFGLLNAAKLANELENLLARPEITNNENLQTSLFEGIELLISTLLEKTDEISDRFLKKSQNETGKIFSTNAVLITDLPYRIFRNLSETEKKSLIDVFCAKKNIFSISVGFEKSDFLTNYKILREILSQNGEIIATLSDSEVISRGEIGFKVLLSTNETFETFSNKIAGIQVKITEFSLFENSSNNLSEMLSEIVKHTRNSKKNVGLTVLANDVSLSMATTKAIFEILLHLVRNAIDHAFENNGELKIFLFAEDKNLFLTISDNGKGVNLEKVRHLAIEKNMILSDDTLNEQQTLELIFTSELSTAEVIGEISGRGVGLDIVKSAVEKLNGKISVKSRKDFGTKFEIVLPLEEI